MHIARTLLVGGALLASVLPLDAQHVRRRAVRVSPPAPVIERSFDFNEGADGWEGDFADYTPAANYPDLELEWRIAPLPPEVGTGHAFYIQSDNHSDDLFMFLRRRLEMQDGVRPDRSYVLQYRIVFASNAPSGCPGIGGSPGESVWMKAGGSPFEPKPVLDSWGDLRMNIDKGNQSMGGEDAGIVTTIGNGNTDCTDPAYVSLERYYRHPSPVRSSSEGDLWLLVGTDSGFEGKTALYYQRIEVRLTEIESPRSHHDAR
jgi:hypothetical protein